MNYLLSLNPPCLSSSPRRPTRRSSTCTSPNLINTDSGRASMTLAARPDRFIPNLVAPNRKPRKSKAPAPINMIVNVSILLASYFLDF